MCLTISKLFKCIIDGKKIAYVLSMKENKKEQ
jgi:hypothetical protein